MRTLYLTAAAATGLPDACAVVQVRPLLRELILEDLLSLVQQPPN